MPFSSPRDDRWFEDYVAGETHDCGTFSVTEGEIVEFARKFDPLPFHLDAEAAKHSLFGGLVASGLHTMAMMNVRIVEHYNSTVSTLAGLGLDEIRLPKPLRAGQVARVHATVIEARVSASKPDRGVIRTRAEVLDESGDVLLHALMAQLTALRPT